MYAHFISCACSCILKSIQSSCPVRAPAPNVLIFSFDGVSFTLFTCPCGGLMEVKVLVNSLKIPVVSFCILCPQPFDQGSYLELLWSLCMFKGVAFCWSVSVSCGVFCWILLCCVQGAGLWLGLIMCFRVQTSPTLLNQRDVNHIGDLLTCVFLTCMVYVPCWYLDCLYVFVFFCNSWWTCRWRYVASIIVLLIATPFTHVCVIVCFVDSMLCLFSCLFLVCEWVIYCCILCWGKCNVLLLVVLSLFFVVRWLVRWMTEVNFVISSYLAFACSVVEVEGQSWGGVVQHSIPVILRMLHWHSILLLSMFQYVCDCCAYLSCHCLCLICLFLCLSFPLMC